MTIEELTTRGPFDKDPGVLVRWMLKSGQPDPRVDRSGLPGRAIRAGIQLYVPSGGRIVELDFNDVHEAGDLYVALEAHMENVSADSPMEARFMTQEEREAMTPNVPRLIPREAARLADMEAEADRNAEEARLASPVTKDPHREIFAKTVRNWTDDQARGAWNHAMEDVPRPGILTDRPTGREYSTLASRTLRDRLNQINRADADRPDFREANLQAFKDEIDNPLQFRAKPDDGVDPEFLAAMDDVLQAWTNPGPVPPFHEAAKDATRRDWPTLAAALDRLAALNA